MIKIVLISLLTIITFFPKTGYCDDAIVLKYSTQIEVLEKKCIQTVTTIVQINNSKGDQYTNFHIPYSDNCKLKKLTGEIRDSNNLTIRKLTNKDITTSSQFDNSTFYNDNFVKQFSLKHNKYPYIIECDYQYEQSPFLQIASWNPMWDDEVSTQSADLSVIFPPDFQFKTNLNNIEKPKITQTERGIIYKWQSSYSRLKANDIFSPSLYDSLPSVKIVPLHFNYIKPGSFDSWKSMGEWELSIDEGLEDLTGEEKIHIDQITEGIKDPRKIVSLLYHYLQDNTRYILVDIDLGGLQPYPASYVCKNKFGDCKALTNYMKAMLAYKGIKSNKVDVSAGVIARKFYTDFPSQQFNHVFLAVPFLNDTIWLECTSNSSPFNYIGASTQNRQILWTEPNKSRLLKTPALKKEDVTSIKNYHFSKPDINQKIILEASFKLRGDSFNEITYINKNWSEKEKKEHFNAFFEFKNYQSVQYQIISVDRDSSFVVFKTKGTCNTLFHSVGEYTKVDLPPMGLPVFEKVKDRESSVKIDVPLAQIDTILYDLNSNLVELKSEKQLVLESIYGKLEMNLSVNDGCLKIIRKHEIPVQEVALAQYKDFYDFINKLIEKGGSIYIKP